jgi:hypothetical protein
MTNSDVGVLGARRRIRTLESSSSVSFNKETSPLRWAAARGRGRGSAQLGHLRQSADADKDHSTTVNA